MLLADLRAQDIPTHLSPLLTVQNRHPSYQVRSSYQLQCKETKSYKKQIPNPNMRKLNWNLEQSICCLRNLLFNRRFLANYFTPVVKFALVYMGTMSYMCFTCSSINT